LQKDIDLLEDHKCHACGQELHDEKQEENISGKKKDMERLVKDIARAEKHEEEYKLKLAELGTPLERQEDPVQPICETVDRIEPDVIGTFYTSFDEAHNHKSTLETLSTQLETAMNTSDPYTEQIEDMETNAIVEPAYEEMNRLTELQEHQAFLLKLLTNKDSFIRKKIIEQNLAYLNNRLTHYLHEIGLPHTVRFMSDLSVEISDMGRDLDFDNLSRGERTRLILSLSWAFRDVWESLYNHVNLLFVDELVDNGLDSLGVESAIKIMKGMSRERGKSVWLVSHREELLNRVNNTMKVVKESGFTIYEGSVD
jgi:DNA repair exonuclease SbcCD ATPase subunit